MNKKQVKQYAQKILELEKRLYNKDLSQEEKMSIQRKIDEITEEIIGLEGGIDNLLAIDDYIQKFL
jgi:hypothetical protein